MRFNGTRMNSSRTFLNLPNCHFPVDWHPVLRGRQAGVVTPTKFWQEAQKSLTAFRSSMVRVRKPRDENIHRITSWGSRHLPTCILRISVVKEATVNKGCSELGFKLPNKPHRAAQEILQHHQSTLESVHPTFEHSEIHVQRIVVLFSGQEV